MKYATRRGNGGVIVTVDAHGEHTNIARFGLLGGFQRRTAAVLAVDDEDDGRVIVGRAVEHLHRGGDGFVECSDLEVRVDVIQEH